MLDQVAAHGGQERGREELGVPLAARLGEQGGQLGVPQCVGVVAVVLPLPALLQNFTGGHPHARGIRERGEIVTATGDGRVAFVDAEDSVAVGARALTDEHPHNTAHLITGPQAPSTPRPPRRPPASRAPPCAIAPSPARRCGTGWPPTASRSASPLSSPGWTRRSPGERRTAPAPPSHR
ncbi:hypothetical protein JQK87_14140 [Streptomyces sp. G44]|uniref:hypothetical protein n=1 Tax=Streptomyces sp. G44 TaxID=2807632 RepID=UPI00195F339C|nr:hypothetical protein [Streptomyces sp. G44]MBM7169533.1 hypothetical protein [Streptomyces sp. G44]